MNYRGVLFLLGRLLVALGVTLLVPGVAAHLYDESTRGAFFFPAALVGISGLLLERFFRQQDEFSLGRREAFLLVTAAWVFATIAGALPFMIYEGPSFVIDALFESASGFTTTGASIYFDVESLPHSILLWRALTQWLGGMGIIVLGIAVLPKLAVGGMWLLQAEATGPVGEKLTPRISGTAEALWGIYILLTAIEALLLFSLGLKPLDAITHSFSTMATGGFSTQNESIASFGSPAIEWVVTVFMILGGISFALYYHSIRWRWKPIRENRELRLYLGILFLGTLIITIDLLSRSTTGGVVEVLRYALFQAVSITTGTGFTTADYNQWPHVSRTLLWILMFVGGCAGSTGGSIKVVRLLIVFKKIVADVRRIVQPHAVIPVRVGKVALSDSVVSQVMTFFVLFLVFFLLGGILLTGMGVDPVTAFSASAACLTNVGPGFGEVGPMMNYASIPALGKCVLAVMMIVGRLELYTVLVLLFFHRFR